MIFETQIIRIAFFTDMLIVDFDGASRTMFELIKRLPKNRVQILFIGGELQSDLLGHESYKVPNIAIPINKNYKLALPGITRQKILKRLANFEPHVIHIATPSLLGRFALKYATEKGLPIISIYHTHFISYIDYYLKHLPWLVRLIKPQIQMTQREFYNQCSVVYVPSETIVTELVNMGISFEKLKLWKRGINTMLFSPQKRDRGFISNITGRNWFTIVFASRLVWEKNLETLIKIYAIAQERRYEWDFIIAGDGIAANTLRQEMKHAFFTGNLHHETLSILYASADLFLFPSVSETYGNVVVEAMASGIPCVVANGGGSRDLIEHGYTGFTCTPFDAMDYITHIEQIQLNQELKQLFSKNGLTESALLNWDILVNRYYDDVVQLVVNKSLCLINKDHVAI